MMRFHPVIAALIVALVASCSTPGEPDEPGEPEEPDQKQVWTPAVEIDADNRKPLVLVGLDGVKPEYLEAYESITPHLNQLADEGVRAESMKPVFPTQTFPNLYSIVTGLYPENHGIVANRVYDPDRDEILSMGDEDAQMESSWWGGEPIWVTAEQQGLTAGTFFWVGSQAEIRGTQPSHWVEYDSSIRHSDRTDQVIEWLTADDPVDFATLYFASPDGAGHDYGTRSRRLAETLQGVDEQIGRLIAGLEAGGVWPDVNLVIVSDHGMTDLDDDKVVILDDIIDLDDVEVIEWTPVSMIKPEEGKADEVYAQLEAEDDHYTVYRRHELPERFRLAGSERVPEIVVVADKPYTLTSRSYHNQHGVLSGGHGFDPEYSEMHGIFIGHGPHFAGGRHTETLQIVDIYALMSHLLALAPAEHDGSLERIGRRVLSGE